MRVPGAFEAGLRSRAASGVRALVTSCSIVCFMLVSGIFLFLSDLTFRRRSHLTLFMKPDAMCSLERIASASRHGAKDLSRREDRESTFGPEFSTSEHQLRIVNPRKRIALVNTVAHKQLNSLRTRHPC